MDNTSFGTGTTTVQNAFGIRGAGIKNILVSNDGGTTFDQVSSMGQDFMGTIWIDPADPDTAIAPSMQAGAVKSTDGGVTWEPLGSSSGSMSIAVDGDGRRIVAIGMAGAEQSTDRGRTWSPVGVPGGTSAAAYTAVASSLSRCSPETVRRSTGSSPARGILSSERYRVACTKESRRCARWAILRPS